MMRSGRAPLLAAAVGPNITDWTPLRSRLEEQVVGKCFDKTVLDSSPIPTRHLQQSLFRLPIPALEDTCKRYTAAIQPLVPPAQFEKSVKHIDEFVKGGVGKQLQEELVRTDKANPHTSFISADWFDLYLKDRTPLPIHYNPSLVARHDPDKRDGLVRAAFWLASSARWYKKYRDNTLKPEVFYFGDKTHFARKDWFSRTIALCPKGFAAKAMAIGSKFHAFPLDMSQYDNLFNSTRVPGSVVDSIKASGFVPHIVVNYKGNQYKVTIADEALGEPLPEDQIYARLKQIVERNDSAPKVDVGVFTSMNRTEWHAVRTAMERQPVNQQSFEAVDSAILVLDLDLDFSTDFLTQPGCITSNRQFLVANQNRWWDKSVSVVATKDGSIGVNFEHSWGDGVAVLRYTVDCFNDSIARPAGSGFGKGAKATEPIQKLEWVLSPAEEATATTAHKRLTDEMNKMDFSVCVYEKFGNTNKKLFKGNVRADPFLQMSMQLAWWRLYQSTVSTYESASTAAYKRGRTECIRSASMESQAFTLAFDNKSKSDTERYDLLAAATTRHAAITSEAKMGKGIDRHFFALKKVAERRGGALPAIFQDPTYTTFGSNMISTSTLYSDALLGGGFGPVSPGYGIGYAAAPESVQFSIACWKQSGGGPRFSAEEFGSALYQSIDDIAALVLAQNSKNNKKE